MSAQFRSPSHLAFVCAGVALFLWSVPLFRCFIYLQEVAPVYRETGSINAANDLDYGVRLLAGYLSSCTGLALAGWFAIRHRSAVAASAGFVLLWSLAEVIRFRPEEPVVMLPTINPERPWRWLLLAAGLVVAGVWNSGRRVERRHAVA